MKKRAGWREGVGAWLKVFGTAVILFCIQSNAFAINGAFLLWSRTSDASKDECLTPRKMELADNGDLLLLGRGDVFSRFDSEGNIVSSASFAIPNFIDKGRGNPLLVAFTSYGNFIVATRDWTVHKYSSARRLLWSVIDRGKSGEEIDAACLAADKNACCIVGGSRNKVALIRKYDKAGRLLWSVTCWGEGGSTGGVDNIVTTDSGEIYIMGLEVYRENKCSWRIQKYSSDGRLIWNNKYTEPGGGGFMFVNRLALDKRNGDIVAAGDVYRQATVQDMVWVIQRYSSDGKPLWDTSYGQENKDLSFSSLLIDVEGNAMVLGTVGNVAVIRAYSPEGYLLFHGVFNKGGIIDGGVLVKGDCIAMVGRMSGDFEKCYWAVNKYASIGEYLSDKKREIREKAAKASENNKYNEQEEVPVTAPGAIEDKTVRIGIGTFVPRNATSGDAAMATDLFGIELAKTGVVSVMERREISQILDEQMFQKTGRTAMENAVQLGRILNAKWVALGSFGRFQDSYVINVNVVNVETGKIVISEYVSGKTLAIIKEGLKELVKRISRQIGG